MKTRWAMAAALTTAGAIVACSGSAGNSGGQYDSCLESLLGGSCISCLQSHCGGAVAGFETGCGDYLGCICPGGNFSAPNAQSPTCSSKLGESSCISTQQADGGAAACAACESACSLGGGGSSNSGGSGSASSSGGSSNGGVGSSSGGSSSSCGSSVLPGTMAVTLSLTGVDFGDASPDDWRGIGYDLDGKCTTLSSTDTCTLVAGASRNTQDDGANGIDNSYGENWCPIFDALAGNYPCSSGIKQAYLQTDASGTGSLVMRPLVYPVRDVHIALSGSGGMAGGVIPTAGVMAAYQKAAPCISTSLCNASALQSFVTPLVQAADIGADASNTAGTGCDGVSFGIKFSGAMPVSSLPSPPSCPCQ